MSPVMIVGSMLGHTLGYALAKYWMNQPQNWLRAGNDTGSRRACRNHDLYQNPLKIDAVIFSWKYSAPEAMVLRVVRGLVIGERLWDFNLGLGMSSRELQDKVPIYSSCNQADLVPVPAGRSPGPWKAELSSAVLSPNNSDLFCHEVNSIGYPKTSGGKRQSLASHDSSILWCQQSKPMLSSS
ncbi:hypothetical protein VNO77_26689 [Canavalia gladiata]|uniref:Uncharacterized protein n=1 Tax=Canavalia gladiata TaxID=3824 RepID=A0AAN9Q6I2_CANGL